MTRDGLNPPTQRRLAICLLMGLAGVVFFTGLGWGLPSREADAYLLGDSPAPDGEQIMRLAGERAEDPALGANVPQHLLEHRDRILLLNGTPADRAEILRRYRLYSLQPDENTLLMALARMRPARGDFDPRFYQYGGVFIYPVGAALKLASALHFIPLTPKVAYYIDHPALFGRFYIVARAVSALWGVLGIWPVFWIARRLSGGVWLPAAACVGYIFMPGVVNQAHEAKPHLAGAVLMLMAVIAACRYVETGRSRPALGAGILCGLAFGAVLSAVLVFVLLPIMVMLRGGRGRRRALLIASAAGLLAYVVTNPYVAINLVRNRAVLRSNLTNSTEMYHVGGLREGIPNAIKLIGAGATPGFAMVGAVTILAALRSARKEFTSGARGGRATLAILLAAPSLLILMQFTALAAGKPAEYGRFALFLNIALMLAAIAGIGRLVRSRIIGGVIVTALLLATIVSGLNYLAGFIRDSLPHNSRLTAADMIRQLAGGEPESIAVWAEPAPYAVPPVNLVRTQLFLLPRDYVPVPGHPPAQVLVRAEDFIAPIPPQWAVDYDRFVIQPPHPTPLSWAAKPFVIYIRRNP